MLNALTIDVEDYFQVSNFEGVVKRQDWDKHEHRVVNNTRKILDILSRNNIKATFFVLGWTAEKFPELVKNVFSSSDSPKMMNKMYEALIKNEGY